MPMMFKFFFSCLLCLSLTLLSGCGGGGNNAGSGTSAEPGAAASAQSKGAADVPSDRDLNETVKRGLNRETFADVPFDITDLSVNWTDKTASEATGRFSVKAKTSEKLYKSVDTQDGLKILGIAEQYEGELNVARNKIGNLPEPHKTNLNNAIPKEQMNRFRFYDVQVPLGGEVTVTGSIELTKYGDDWRSDKIRANPFSIGTGFTPESKLQNAYKLDDPKTKEAVEALIQERKDFVARVDATVAELEQQRLATLKKQKEDFAKFCAPGKKYEGSFAHREASGAVLITFDEWAVNDQNSVKGTIIFLNRMDVKIPFTVAVNIAEVTEFPVTGTYILPDRHNSNTMTLRVYELSGGARNGMEDILSRDSVSIKFTDKMDFAFGTDTRRVSLNVTEAQ